MSESAGSASVGDESALTFTVTVTPAVNETIGIYGDGGLFKLCDVTISTANGSGTCALGNDELGPGLYLAGAITLSGADYTGSFSNPVAFSIGMASSERAAGEQATTGVLRVGLPGGPGHRAAGQVLGRPAGVAECLRRRGGAAADMAGHHDGDVAWDLVEAVAQLPERDVDADGVGPGLDLVGLADVDEEHVLAVGDACFDLVGLHLGIGHGVTLRRGAPQCPGSDDGRRYAGPMALPRRFLNEDEELLAELRPHWIFLFGPLFTSIGVWAGLIVLVILWHNAPSWTNYPILIIALIPGLWLLGRVVRWRSYVVALTSTRILVRQGILGRDTVQLRLQRITEVNIRQELIERMLGTGSLIIDVQGEDDSLTLEYMRKPAVVQRVINSQINEIVGGGRREAIPADMQPRDRYGAPYADRRDDDGPRRRRRHAAGYDDAHDTPPFGVGGTAPATAGAAPAATPAPAPPPANAAQGTAAFEIRDRLIELDDLRRRGILSEEEFAAKKSELLNRI